MGSNPGAEGQQIIPINPNLLDDSGQLSIDLMIGLSIFLVTLIIAMSMTSGLLVGLQSKHIDYDAVAYRTGVILVEDPGEPNTLVNYITITEKDEWEFIGYDQKDMVKRFGLTVYKSAPRILTEQKIFSFFNKTRFPDSSEYRDRVIFGDYPYRFNITLKIQNDFKLYTVGDPFTNDSAYGYIRRVVLVKKPSSAIVDMGKGPYYNETTPGNGRFYVTINYSELLKEKYGPAYWIEPPKEDITINLTNISGIKNQTSANPVLLNNVRVEFYGKTLQGLDVSGVLPVGVPARIDGTAHMFSFPDISPVNVNSTVNITFPAGFFIPPSSIAGITLNVMNVRYDFDPTTVNITESSNYSYSYSSESQGFSPPMLTPGVMEVRIW